MDKNHFLMRRARNYGRHQAAITAIEVELKHSAECESKEVLIERIQELIEKMGSTLESEE